MRLPFTSTDFFQLLADYNAQMWPVALALWAASALAAASIIRGHAPHRAVSALLAVHWAWSGLAYHAGYFTTINPAAWLFAAAFVAQAMLFIHYGVVRDQLRYEFDDRPRHRVAAVLVVYSLIYPALSIADGPASALLSSPAPGLAIGAPLFAVPCPTTLFTAGVLLTATRLPAVLILVPTAWSWVGGSAALLLGVRADFALFAAAVLLVSCAGVWRRPQPMGS